MVRSVWISAQRASIEAKARKRTLVHATLKNLELLAEGHTVVWPISQRASATVVTVPAGSSARRQVASYTSTSRAGQGYR